MLGSGAIIVVDDSTSVVDVALKTAKFYRHESCGKCTPCREGTNWTVKMLERIDAGEATPMDLDIMASVQEQHHRQLPVRAGRRDGDADRLDDRQVPRRVRGPHRGRAGAQRAGDHRRGAAGGRHPGRGGLDAAPRAADGDLLDRRPRGHRAREHRCWSTPPSTATSRSRSSATSPSSAQPVGACRMCLVEIEGIPKLQTGCSTPVKDGMVVHTQTDRVQARAGGGRRVPAHQPPARLPGLRQGRRVPAAGHLLRLGRRALALHRAQAPLRRSRSRSRPLDRDRPRALHPLLPLRALQPGDLRGLPAGPRRSAARTPTSATFDGHPYVAPFSGNIIELCPVGALTSQPYRFRARPWDIEGSGSVCTLCPAQCNVTFTVRDERVLRVLGARQRRGRRRLAVRQGPLRLPVDPRRRAHHRSRWCATAASCARSRWERALDEAAAALERASGPRRRDRRRRDDQRGGLPPAAPHARGPGLARPRLARRRARSPLRAAPRARRARRCRRRSPTSSSPTPCSCSTASRSTTCRSSTCASARACAATASSSRWPRAGRRRWTPTRPRSARFAPGAGEAFVAGARRRRCGRPARGGRRASRRPRAPTPTPCARSPRAAAAPARTS